MNGVNQTKVNSFEEVNRELENIRKLLVDLPYYSGNGSPENIVSAKLGSFYSDLRNGDIYGKKSNDGKNSGWEILNESVASGIVASYGATQATATELTASINIISTCAVSLHAVRLNPAIKKQQVRNDGACILAVYPPTNGYINGLSQNAYFRVLPGNTIDFAFIDSLHAKTLETGSQQTKTNILPHSGTSWTAGNSAVIFYLDLDGKLYGEIQTDAVYAGGSNPTLTYTGVTFKTGIIQTFAVSTNSGGTLNGGQTNPGASTVVLWNSAGGTQWRFKTTRLELDSQTLI